MLRQDTITASTGSTGGSSRGRAMRPAAGLRQPPAAAASCGAPQLAVTASAGLPGPRSTVPQAAMPAQAEAAAAVPPPGAAATAPAVAPAAAASERGRPAITPAAPPTLRPGAGEVLYFAYGSNMAPSVLTGRRRIRPAASLPACVADHALSFSMRGFPYSEPGFATIVDLPPPQQQQRRRRQQQLQHGAGLAPPTVLRPVHGVVHRISRREWEFLKLSEGVGSDSIGYQVVRVTCRLYDGAAIEALTLKAAAASLHGDARHALPSPRYLSLLREGAVHHRLAPEYRDFLVALRPYRPASGVQQALGALASGAVLLSAAAPAVPVYVAGRAMGLLPEPARPGGGRAAGQRQQQERQEQPGGSSGSGSLLPFVSAYANVAQSFTWWVHDTALAPVLGSGCSNDGKPK